mmetsp:Transcript_18718/g.44960  ORF Transcript_18718/g.44960 Transcript_18718/m.44960 type:complete len:205 (+) Transcript_18718:88-702(+)
MSAQKVVQKNSPELSGQAHKVAKMDDENEPKLLDQAGDKAKSVLDQAGKVASDVNKKATDFFKANPDSNEIQADEVAKEAASPEKENRSMLDQAGEVANLAFSQVGQAASYVKKAIIPGDATGYTKVDGENRTVEMADENESKKTGIFDQVGKATVHVLDEAGKAASDVKAQAFGLVHTATDPGEKSNGRTGVKADPVHPGPDY